jgi:transcriptional regulator with XRE-family HTH domain
MTSQHSANDHLATLGGRLRAVRLAKELSADEVAAHLKVKRPTYSLWELGKVDRVPEHRIDAFAELTGVSAQWLLHRTGKQPDLPMGNRSGRRRSRSNPPVGISPALAPAPAQPDLPPSNVVEITPKASAHARALDTAPQAKWSIPREVLTLGFNCDPEEGFIKRVPIDGPPLPDGTPVNRGDYVLIDSTRTEINEVGLYYVADPNGREVKRVLASQEEGELVVRFQGASEKLSVDELEVLGRAMAVFHAI